MIRSFVVFLVLTLLFLGGCQLASMSKASRGMLPSPGAVLESVAANQGPLLRSATFTLRQATAGLALAAVLAIITVCLAGRFPAFERAIYPYVVMLKATPALAFVPLIVSVCGSDFAGKAAIAGIIAFMPLAVGTLGGLTDVPPQLRELRRHCQPDHWTYFRAVSWPFVLTKFCFSLKMAAPMAIVGAIVGEFVMGGADEGLGAFIMSASSSIRMPNVAAAGVTATVLGVALFGLAHVLYFAVREKLNIAK